MTDTMTNIATALASVTTALASLTREINHTRGLASALEERIAALEKIAVNQMNNAPAGPTTTEYLQSRNGVLFIGPKE